MKVKFTYITIVILIFCIPVCVLGYEDDSILRQNEKYENREHRNNEVFRETDDVRRTGKRIKSYERAYREHEFKERYFRLDERYYTHDKEWRRGTGKR